MIGAPVYLVSTALRCSAGNSVEDLWSDLKEGRRRLVEPPFPLPDDWPWQRAFRASEPSADELGIDRKQLRTMDSQARHALITARHAFAGAPTSTSISGAQIGLFMGIPAVDEPAPPWSLLEAMHQRPPCLTTEIVLSETPPFAGLSLLNSSACAHISNTLRLTGPTAAFSPFADAGLQALVEGALAISEGECEAALAGAVAPTLTPLRTLQHEHHGWHKMPTRIPGEGAAFTVLSRTSDTPRPVRIQGYARGFVPSDRPEALRVLLGRCLEQAGIRASEVGWCLGPCSSPESQAAFRAVGVDLDRCMEGACHACGELGPAEPVANVLLSYHGLRRGERLQVTAHGVESRPLSTRHALVTASGPEGQYAALLLAAGHP